MDFSQYGGASDEWRAAEATMTFSSASEGFSPTELRDRMNANREKASAEAMTRLAPLVRTADHSIPSRDGTSTIPARSYRPVSAPESEILPVFLFFHGGGFLMGTLGTEDATCSAIAAAAGVVVLHVCYRHTPDVAYPVPWDDSEDGFIWLHANTALLGVDPQRVIVGGISAGAQLTASLVLRKNMGEPRLRDLPAIAGQTLFIPCLAHIDAYGPQLAKMRDPSISSYKENADAPMLNVKTVRLFTGLLGVENPDPKDLRLSPGNASVEDVKGLPPATFGIAGLDPLRDEGLLYSQLLAEAGVPTDTYLFEGVPHAFRRFPELSQAKRWDAAMIGSVKWALSKPAAGAFEVKTTGP
ncbi:lipase [Plectosphaerella cucumerina]|uniref:Lipase n=1 Tax=Plectosphaerella cucumerina TaxID=40658 RepID=A0A8K0X498_9PEZI|nr:lipase [Plectosphaerella cucumerina]